MSFDFYFNFDGDCCVVFDFYKQVFGGEFIVEMIFVDGLEDMLVVEDDKDKIMYVLLLIGDSIFMGSDVLSDQSLVIFGSNVYIFYVLLSVEIVKECFVCFLEGGIVMMFFEEQFWGDFFGSCIDCFGVYWMFNFILG